MTIHSAQKKNVAQTTNLYNWIRDLFSAVGQVLSEWVNTYQIFSENKVEADTLNFCDTVKTLQAAAACHVMTDRPMKFAKGSFELSSEDKKAQSLVRDILESDNEKLTNQWKKMI